MQINVGFGGETKWMEKVTDAEYRSKGGPFPPPLGSDSSELRRGSPKRRRREGGRAAIMPIRVVRLGTPREPGEGVRLGTVRRPPRASVRKEDVARRDYYDVWAPELAPSAPLVKQAFSEPWTDKRWTMFAKKYRAEMRAPAAQHVIAILVALSARSSFSVGCYCENEARCHRSILREILAEAGALIS